MSSVNVERRGRGTTVGLDQEGKGTKIGLRWVGLREKMDLKSGIGKGIDLKQQQHIPVEQPIFMTYGPQPTGFHRY